MISIAKEKVLLVGGGNSCHLLAPLFANQPNLECHILALHEYAHHSWSSEFEILSEYPQYQIKANIAQVTNDPKIACKGAKIIIFTVPANGYLECLEKICDYIEPKTYVGSVSSSGGVFWIARFALKNVKKQLGINLWTFDVFPFSCRTVEPGKSCRLNGYKSGITLTVENENEVNDGSRERFHKIFEESLKMQFVKGANFLTGNLLGWSLAHPTIIYSFCMKNDRTKGRKKDEYPLFYRSVSDDTVQILNQMDEEIQTIKQKINEIAPKLDLSLVVSNLEMEKKYYSQVTPDNSSLKACFHTCKSYEGVQYPLKEENGLFFIDFQSRFLREDILFGLCIFKNIGEFLNLKLPTIEKLISFISEIWVEEILNEEGKLNMGYIKKSYNNGCPINYEINSMQELIDITSL